MNKAYYVYELRTDKIYAVLDGCRLVRLRRRTWLEVAGELNIGQNRGCNLQQ